MQKYVKNMTASKAKQNKQNILIVDYSNHDSASYTD